MLYSIQNARGKVFGVFPMPETDRASEDLAGELVPELCDILGVNGVRSVPWRDLEGTEEERVVIDIEPDGPPEVRIARVHATIGRLTMLQPEQ